MQNELAEAMKAETFYEGDNPLSFADEDHAEAAMVEHEASIQQDNSSDRSVATDFEGLPLFVVSDMHGNCAVDSIYQ